MRNTCRLMLAAGTLLAGGGTGFAQLEVILEDDFDTSTSFYDINAEVDIRQGGSSRPVLYTEREEHMAGGLADEFTVVENGRLYLLVDGTTWVAPAYNFINGATFTIEVTFAPSEVNPDLTSDDWSALVFGATAPGAFVNSSDGMGILFRNNGGYQVFDGAQAIYSSTPEDVLPPGDLRLRVEVTGENFAGTAPATVTFTVNGQPLKITEEGGNSYTRTGGFRGNYLTLLAYATPGNFWYYPFDDLRVSAESCVHFSESGVVLRPGDAPPSVTVRVPQDFAAGGPATVRVRSSNPDVATPVGATDGELELSFSGNAPADLSKTFDLEVSGKGGAILELLTDQPGCVGEPFSVASLSALVRNPSFEDNTITTFPGYGPVNEWTGMSGVNALGVNNGGPFHDNGVYPDRTQIGFKQGNGPVSQEISGLVPNQRYWLQVRYNIRNCCGTFSQNMIVRFDGVELETISGIQAVGSDNPYHSRTFVFTAAAETGLLEIESTGEGDHTLLLDAITIVPRDEGNVNVQNPSFEASGNVPGTGIISPANISGWEGEGTYGVNLGGAGPFADNGTVPDQDNAAFIQGVGSLSQRLIGLIPGQTYTVIFAVNASTGSSPHLQVTAGETVLLDEDISPVGGGAPYTLKTNTFVAAENSVELRFAQTAEGQTVLLDDVRVLGEAINIPPIEVSPEAAELAVGVTGVTINVNVPAVLIATEPATVTVTSQDPAVAIPAGATGGALTLTFEPGGPTSQTVEVQAVGRGTTTFRFTNAQNVSFNNDEVTISVSGSFVRNPSFESNFHPTFPGYGPIDAWSSEGPGNTGVNNDGGPFHDNGVIPDRAQIALLQVTKTIRQEIVNLTPGETHWLQFFYNARNCCGGVISLTPRFGDMDLDFIDSVTPVGETNPYYSRTLVFTPTSSSGLLEFVAIADGDATVLLDAVSIVQRDEDDIVIMNPSFEASGRVAFPGYIQPQSIAGWTSFGGGNWGVNVSGIGPFADNGVNPDQDSVAFLQGLAGIRQTVTGLTPGTSYVLSVAVNARGQNSPRLRITADGNVLFDQSIVPVGGTSPYHVVQVNLTPAGDTVEIAFEQTAEGDNTVLLDDVRIRPGMAAVTPSLQAGRSGAGIRLSWPADADGYVLQTSASVVTGWADSTLPVNVENGQNVVTDTTGDAAKFYRLISR